MKLWYDYKSKDPTYFIQKGIRNGKKVTTKNVMRIGKHSELLAITDDPLAYAKEQVRNHIIGHFITCYTALLVYRLLETKLNQAGTHFTTNQILETLKVMNVMNFQDAFYAAAYTESDVGIALNAAFDLGLNKKYYEPKELNRKLRNILK